MDSVAEVSDGQGRIPALLVPHLLAVGIMAWQAWLVWQPNSGDLALWSPAAATFLVAAIWLVAGGVFARLRWGTSRPLMVADVAALPAVFFGSLSLVLFVPGLVTAVLLVVGLAMTWRTRHRGSTVDRTMPRLVGWASLALLAAPVVLLWWYALSVAYDVIGTITGYGLPEVMIGGIVGAAVLFWLDRRPGLLLGSGACLVYFGGLDAANASGDGSLYWLIEGWVLLVSGVFGVVFAGSDVMARRGIDLVVPLAVAAGAAGAILLEPMLGPLVVVAALVLERRVEPVVPSVTAMPASS